MNSTRKLILAAVVLSQTLVTLPALADGAKPVVRLETMHIVGKRAPAASVSPTAAAAAVSPAPDAVVRLETMVIIGHREGQDAATRVARMNNGLSTNRATPL